jgi:DNA-binding MarR family transcriptional regulator
MDDKRIVLETVEMISQLMGELESKAFEHEGFSDITMNQMHYLETIPKLSNPTSADLADNLGVSRPSVSVIVKKLIETDYLTKSKSKTDGRVYYLHLTEKGLRFNQLHSEVHQILARRITENLNLVEIDELAGLLGKLTHDKSLEQISDD